MAEVTGQATHGGEARLDRRKEPHGDTPAWIFFGLSERFQREPAWPLSLDNALGELRRVGKKFPSRTHPLIGGRSITRTESDAASVENLRAVTSGRSKLY